MHRHNFELIAEYAQGSLDDEARARSLVESCARCRTIYDEQLFARNALGPATTAFLTEHEKAALHRDLWTELRSPTAATEKRTWWRSSWAFGAATVLVIGIGLAGVLNNQDATTETFSEVGADLDGGASDGLETEDSLAPSAETPSTPSAETTSTSAVAAVADVATYEGVTEEVRSAEGTTDSYSKAAVPEEGSTQQECLQNAGLDNFLILEAFETVTSLIVAIPQDQMLSTTPIVFVDPDTCTIVHREN